MNEITVRYLQQGDINFREIGEDILSITKARLVLVNIREDHSLGLVCRGIAGNPRLVSLFQERAGFALIGHEWEASSTMENTLAPRRLSMVPLAAVWRPSSFDKFAANHFIAAMGLWRGATLLGNVCFLLRKNSSVPPGNSPENCEGTELLLHQVCGVLQRKYIADHTRGRGIEIRRQLDNQLAFTRTILDTIPGPIFYKDLNGKYLGCNKVFEYYTGLTRKKVIGRTAYQIWNKELADQYTRMDQDLLRVGGSKIYIAEVLRADGKPRTVRVHKAVYTNSGGEVRGIVGFILDITQSVEQRQMIEKSLVEKDILLREVHHRVKNNLQIVSSLLNLQQSVVSDETTKRYLQSSKNRINALALIHDHLYSSENIATVPMEEYIVSLGNQLRHTYSTNAACIEITYSIVPVELDIDRAINCGLLITELLANSLRHAFPPGEGGGVFVSFVRDGDKYVLKISDNGRDCVWFPEETEESSIGLQLVKGLTQQLDGSLSAEVTSGCHVTVSFPVAAVEDIPES